MNDLDVLERHQALVHHAVEQRDELPNALFRIDDFDQNRQIRREIEDAGRVDDGMPAETFDAFEYRSAGKSALPRRFHDRRVERLAAVTIALTDKDAKEFAGALEFHRLAVLP